MVEREDWLHQGMVLMESVPSLDSGTKILSELEQLMERDEPIVTPLKGNI